MIKNKTHTILWFLLLSGLVVFLSLTVPQSAQAQCGSSASSCKNCHEVQGEDPVNSDGTNWHEAHAFGDFCEFCHAGNVQATDKETAHVGLEAPLDNVQVSCGNCHAADLDERANVYAVALGVEIGSGGGSGSEPPANTDGGSEGGGETAVAPSPAKPDTSSSAPSAPSGLVVNDPNVIDYVARYNETVLGIKIVNWGDRILLGLIAITLVGGGGFVVWNERRRQQPISPVSETVLAEQKSKYPDYPPQVIALLPRLSQLSADALQDLYQFLEDPTKAQTLLHDLVRLQPDLVHQVRQLNRESQALLFSLASTGD
ncbi:MAG: hypothetical protein KBE23_16100 [Chloroflexi bacterium]|nr:hypothetical protein [Chloroflexota bacterium]MBP7044273.1 hypothetical protein [Chloroflexota bacterium]